MKEFFFFSDCHGNKDELQKAIDKSGFDKNNPNHFLVGLGDYFDRFNQPQEIMDYLNSIKRKILVLGNHEELLMDCINRGYPMSHDWHNGTAQTIIDLAPNAKSFDVACSVAYEKVKDFIDGMVNYIELTSHIGVHSFIPTKCNKDWRDATDKEWNDSRWGNPYELAKQGLLPEKTLVFGHFHTSYPRAKYHGEEEFGPNANFDIYYGNGYVAIDGCIAAHNGKINVLNIEDDFIDG